MTYEMFGEGHEPPMVTTTDLPLVENSARLCLMAG